MNKSCVCVRVLMCMYPVTVVVELLAEEWIRESGQQCTGAYLRHETTGRVHL